MLLNERLVAKKIRDVKNLKAFSANNLKKEEIIKLALI